MGLVQQHSSDCGNMQSPLKTLAIPSGLRLDIFHIMPIIRQITTLLNENGIRVMTTSFMSCASVINLITRSIHQSLPICQSSYYIAFPLEQADWDSCILLFSRNKQEKENTT